MGRKGILGAAAQTLVYPAAHRQHILRGETGSSWLGSHPQASWGPHASFTQTPCTISAVKRTYRVFLRHENGEASYGRRSSRRAALAPHSHDTDPVKTSDPPLQQQAQSNCMHTARLSQSKEAFKGSHGFPPHTILRGKAAFHEARQDQ
ncbi:hypothetical protein cyc_04377 [Cyclospora cayetanensis]|uniref:Uncharacterized protein n=1 Tax=Cyclospora cayetanensis TaxID=88456 RepID=A0A1D3CSJ7_9EIME|nr:hypothetical protein cyc_04377 [Cyclospora cayetanensis]